MDSTHSSEDLELMAALIDGRLTPDERARAMKLLAESDEALELFASAVQDAGQATDGKVIPITAARPRSRRRWTVAVPAAAAALLAFALLPTLTRRGPQGADVQAYVTELGQTPEKTAGLRSDWAQRWSVTRGESTVAAAPAGSPQERRIAFRLGVRSVDLQLALSRGDTLLASRVASEIAETLKGLAFSDLVGSSYADLAARSSTEGQPALIDRAARAEEGLRGFLVKGLAEPYAFGRWSGAAELAAEVHDAAFFSSDRGTRFVEAANAASLTGEDADAVHTIDARRKAALTPPALDEMRDLLQSIIRRRGG